MFCYSYGLLFLCSVTPMFYYSYVLLFLSNDVNVATLRKRHLLSINPNGLIVTESTAIDYNGKLFLWTIHDIK